MTDTPADTITFLGTAGARVMLSKQFLASGGAWLDLGGIQILLDPGPRSLVHTIKRKLNPEKLSAIILSHKHLDHSGDINVMIEAMTEGGRKKRGLLFAPADALETDKEPVILRYLQGFPQYIETLAAGKSYSVDDVTFETPVRHLHGVETYGLLFRTPRHTFSWITDTKYFPDLAAHYKADLVIFNVVRLQAGLPLEHLSIPDVKRLIIEMKPKAAILNHFGMTVWQAHPWEVAEKLADETGVKVIAARDGMIFDLGTL